MVNGLYLYSAFLVLMTTQSSLQYSFTFTHSHNLLFYEGQFRVQHLVQGHLGMQIWKTGDRTADLQVGGLYPYATAARSEEIHIFVVYQKKL